MRIFSFIIMLIKFSVLPFIAIFGIVHCEQHLPEVYIPARGVKIFLPQNPPKLPLLYLSGQKFSLPQCCLNASEWEDIDFSLQILTDYTEPDPERSTFASLINLVKFILIKEELSCIEAIKGPIIQVKRPEGQIFKAVTVENKQILNKIETALANKPKHRATPIEFYDSIDISNMIPIWRPRGNNRRKNQANTAPIKDIKTNCTCNATTNFGPNPKVGGNFNPILKELKSKPACKGPMLALFKSTAPNCRLKSLPYTNVKPVGCGSNCKLCQKLASPVLAGCPKLANSAVLSGCPQTNMVLGCPCPNMFGCPKSSSILSGCHANQALTVLQSEAVPLMNCFGNLMKTVTTTVLVPYTVSQLVAS